MTAAALSCFKSRLKARTEFRAGQAMTKRIEAVEVLEMALEGLPRICEFIAKMEPATREKAFGVAEQRYFELAANYYSEEKAKAWASALVFRLRKEVELRRPNVSSS